MAKPLRILLAAGLAAMGAACATNTGSLNTSPTADPTRGDTFPRRLNGGISDAPIDDICAVRPPITGAIDPATGKPCPTVQNGGEWPGLNRN